MMIEKDPITREAIDVVFTKMTRCFQYPEKAKKICEMRLNGATYEAIGKEVNLSKDRCREYVRRVCRFYQMYLRTTPKKPTSYNCFKMRDRLAELLEEAEGQLNNDYPSYEQMAEYLIEHGVVVEGVGNDQG